MQSAILCLIASISLVHGTEYFVSVNDGSNTNPGTISKPWKHVSKAVTVLQPGDICTIRSGVYYEEVVIANLMGTQDKPIIFRAQPGENVVFDGTGGTIKTTWTKFKDNIYKATLEEDIWQLFVDGDMQINARWPNAFWYDFSVFDYTKWGFSASNSTHNKETGYGVMCDNGTQGLAKSGINATDAIAILNIGSWETFAGHVDSHKPNEPNFSYRLKKPVPIISYNPAKCRYFLEDKLDFLDAPTEWYYNNKTKEIFLWTKDSDNPINHVISGKKSTYAFTISRGSSWLKLESLSFFATTVNIGGETGTAVYSIELSSCHFSYPSYSKRMLGSLDVPDMTKIYHNGDLMEEKGHFRIFNCTFEFSDGQTISYRGRGGVIDNNLWHHNDFSCVGQGFMFSSDGTSDTFIRNTVHSNGPSEGYAPGSSPNNLRVAADDNAKLNMMYDLKYLQDDGSHIQTHIYAQNGTVVEYNWCFDTMKFGIRFDRTTSPGAMWGYNGTINYNVVWNTGGIMVKGDQHHVNNNLVFDSTGMNDMYLLGPGGAGAAKENNNTVTTNNILQRGAGSCTARYKKPCPIVPGKFTNNDVNKDVRTLLRDPVNWDFRPLPNSDLIMKGIGPYGKESMNHGGVYWIPGHQLLTASVPIPPNGTTTAKCDAHLMWLDGYNADSHDVYFGTGKELVTNADKSSSEFKGNMKVPSNIVDPGPLKPDVVYYWRVDAVHDVDRSTFDTNKGKVWQFQCHEESRIELDVQ